MRKRSVSLSEQQLINYRPKKVCTETKEEEFSFAERMALLPASTPRAQIEMAFHAVLSPSACTVDGVEYVAGELGITVDDMRVPQYLLLKSMIEDLGGGLNDGKIVLNVEKPQPSASVSVSAEKVYKNWDDFGREPVNMANMRIGRGVGGGMTKVHIWDMKNKMAIKQGAETWTTETTLAFLATT